ncbi:CLIP domain-containing serine protease B9-like isoform X2 [Condylostylus longicornis]|uniref:CLIP domain-containing serine protease B9-like isoform X2 n=1 Tax=Condylostylus longicornis TaxID=2530218 RepID=UPI00244E35CC|nr:CLIP domain-containing serine protease B9-like isoform X2 [Condylostylus longicornis]
MLILYLNIFLIFVSNINKIFATTTIEACRTPPPENQSGWCVPTKQCKIISDIIGVSLDAFPSKYQTFIENSRCSSSSDERFCCTLNHINRDFASANDLNNPVTPLGQRVDGEHMTEIIKPAINLRVPIIPNVNRPDITNIDTHPNLYLLPNECGLMKYQDKISGGETTGLREFPFMALLEFNRKTPHFGCGGTLINEKYILTAAHCARSDLFSVRLGEYNIRTDVDCVDDEDEDSGFDCNDPVQDIPIESITKHEGYDKFKAVNDIALLRLSKPANTSTNNVIPICLPRNSELRSKVFKKAQLTGWGTTEKVHF